MSRAKHPATGGQHAIAGFLFQILRSVQVGLSVTAKVVQSPEPSMTLTLEPAVAGDLRLDRPGITTIEQVKIRAPHLSWSSGMVAQRVFPDLLNGAAPGTGQLFRFVTDNGKGLGPLGDFLAAWQDRAQSSLGSRRVRWGNERVAVEEFAVRLAARAGAAPGDPRFIWLLDHLSIELVSTATAEAEIDALLAPMLSTRERAPDKRHELMSRLMAAASEGRTIGAEELLAMVGPDAGLRLQHAQTLTRRLPAALDADCRALGYDGEQQVRLTHLLPFSWVTVLSGESGQGKTWSLCQSALALAERGELAIVFRATGEAGFRDAVNERIWLPAHQEPASLSLIERRLAPDLPHHDGCWLTVYLDDVQDRGLAEFIGRTDWPSLGIRLVISAQPRMTEAIRRARPDAEIIAVDNFTSAELRQYLRRHHRDAPLETMPDDVFELLLKPIHARIFTEVPTGPEWVGVTEYELFSAYWTFATSEERAQHDHLQDGEHLADLAGTLLGPRPRYPWRARDLERAGLDDQAQARLEQVGLISRPSAGRMAFNSDRMLNWAVAEFLARQILDEAWTAERAEELLSGIDSIAAQDGTPIGRRLGYVLLDALWLLLEEGPAVFVADLLVANLRRRAPARRSEEFWTRALGTLGPRLLPVIEILACRETPEDHDRDIPRYLPDLLVSIADVDSGAVGGTLERLLATGQDQPVAIALKAARYIPAPSALDNLFSIRIEREHLAAQCRALPEERRDYTVILRRDESMAALKPSAAAAPAWVSRRIGAALDPVELEQLLWLVIDARRTDEDQARAMWTRHRAHFLTALSADSKALVDALGDFGDTDSRARLDAVPRTEEDWLSTRVLGTRARIDPSAALEQIRGRDDDHFWAASKSWLPELVRTDPAGLASAIRENAQKGNHPVTDMVLCYSHFPELMDKPTLDWVLDEFGTALHAFNASNTAETDPHLGPLGHVFHFLPKLTEPWQFDCLARRAGTLLERELVRFATRRRGRTSLSSDIEGMESERILAMIPGDGYSDLVIAELARPDGFGREDGYGAALWSQDPRVAVALNATQIDRGADGHRQSERMQALAVHQCDAELEAMVRANAPVYANAAAMRRAAGRPTAALRTRIEALIETGEPQDLYVAAKLAGFLRGADEAQALVPRFLDPATPDAARYAMIRTFKALGLYEHRFLAMVRRLLAGRIDDDAQLAAAYLAEAGDQNARGVVAEWLETLDLGTWSSSRHGFLAPLNHHEDSRPAVIAFLKRSRDRGHVVRDGPSLRILAADGDALAQGQLMRAAYREPSSFVNDTVAGIAYLYDTNPDEAFFAARRFLARHGRPAAVDLLLEIDPDRALPLLLQHCRKAKPSLRTEIARRLRGYLGGARLSAPLRDLAASTHLRDRLLAVELGGWMPPGVELGWLETFAGGEASILRDAAYAALRKRAREAAAMLHLSAMERSPKPLKWARLNTVIDCVDPYFLQTEGDPADLEAFLEQNPAEFRTESRQLLSRRYKAVGDEIAKLDRDR